MGGQQRRKKGKGQCEKLKERRVMKEKRGTTEKREERGREGGRGEQGRKGREARGISPYPAQGRLYRSVHSTRFPEGGEDTEGKAVIAGERVY